MEKAGMPYFIAAGEKLIEAKATCDHGEFRDWAKRNFNVSNTTLTVWMAAARKSQNVSALTFSSLREAIKTEPKKIEMFDEIIESAKDDDFDRDAWVENQKRRGMRFSSFDDCRKEISKRQRAAVFIPPRSNQTRCCGG